MEQKQSERGSDLPARPSKPGPRKAFILAFLVLATAVAYSPVCHNQFVNYDDPLYITNNPRVFQGLSWDAVKWAFTTGQGSNWHPLTWLSLMLDCQLFGEHVFWHHAENVLWHILNTLLLFGILSRATGAVWRPAMVAALFALHPLHVESVAWASERKDMLSTFFAFLALATYLRYAEKPAFSRYALILLFLAFSLLSKGMWVTFPFVLLLLDVWPLERISKIRLPVPPNPSRFGSVTIRRAILEKMPMLAISAAGSVVTLLAQHSGGAVVATSILAVPDRLGNAASSCVLYLWKTIWPSNLAVFYPYQPGLPKLQIGLSCLVLAVITWIALRQFRKRPYLSTGWFWYLGTLVPVIGLVQVGSQAMADRYTYVPLIGIFIAVVWGASEFVSRLKSVPLIAGLAAPVILACGVLTFVQVGVWRDSITLFKHALAVAPESCLAHHNLGYEYLLRGETAAAHRHLEAALKLMPDYAQAQYNFGNCLNKEGDLPGAMEHYRRAIELKPDYEQAYYGLGNALASQGKFDEAEVQFRGALRLKPDYAEAHIKYGNLLFLENKTDAAMSHFRTAVEIQPGNDEALRALAGACARGRNYEEAVKYFRLALKSNKDNPSTLNDLAWILAAEEAPGVHDPAEAINLAKRACELTQFKDPGYLDTLAAACSEANRFDEAAEFVEKASVLARNSGDAALAEKLHSRVSFYRLGIPYHSINPRLR